MKEKVRTIIKDALGDSDVGQAIKNCFTSPLARQILEAEFYNAVEEKINDVQVSKIMISGHE